MNMINSFLGRLHLASHIDLMNEDQKALVKEGVDYYKKLAKNKKESLPMLPIGFAYEGQKIVSSGLKTGDTLYLALWNLGNDGPGTQGGTQGTQGTVLCVDKLAGLWYDFQG